MIGRNGGIQSRSLVESEPLYSPWMFDALLYYAKRSASFVKINTFLGDSPVRPNYNAKILLLLDCYSLDGTLEE
jgi:hypothetical protein